MRFVLLSTVAFAAQHGGAAAASRAESEASPVQQALKSEAAGDTADRRRLLGDALARDSEDPAARWHSGYLQVEGRWVPFQEAATAGEQRAALAEYRRLRDSSPSTAEGHLKLANWCRRAGLAAQERAHLTAAVEQSGKAADRALLARVGLELAGGQWISRDDRRGAERLVRDQQRAFDAWVPRLQRIARGIASRRAELRERNLAEWKAIDDPDALPAMEAVFSHRDLATVHRLLDVYAGMPTHRAGIALARQAVLSPYVTVREAAAKKLRERPPEEYAPVLLDVLQTPIDARMHLYVSRGGVRMTRTLYRENQSFRELAVLNAERRFLPNYTAGRLPGRIAREFNNARLSAAAHSAVIEAGLNTRAIDRQVELENYSTDELNERICDGLATATGLDVEAAPEAWWQWWLDYNELYSEGEKPCRYTYSFEDSEEPIPMHMPMSCLAAGTPVWTDRGPVPVDQVKVGDLALARHPETGELAYRPVLRTTVRPATGLLKVTAGGDSFVATGGHTFWISGRGWMKIRDAQPGMWFHGATEPVQIAAIEPAGSEPTYNLVVADFHTYFVGPHLVFSHDPTFARPTDVKVPGLAPRPKSQP